jgi:hypothetical protein
METGSTEYTTVLSILEESEWVTDVVQEGAVFVMSFSGGEAEESALLRALILADVRVTSFSRESASMEDVLIKIVGHDHAELTGDVP